LPSVCKFAKHADREETCRDRGRRRGSHLLRAPMDLDGPEEDRFFRRDRAGLFPEKRHLCPDRKSPGFPVCRVGKLVYENRVERFREHPSAMPAKAGIQRACTLFPDSRLRGNRPCNGLRPVQWRSLIRRKDETGFGPAQSLNLGGNRTAL